MFKLAADVFNWVRISFVFAVNYFILKGKYSILAQILSTQKWPSLVRITSAANAGEEIRAVVHSSRKSQNVEQSVAKRSGHLILPSPSA
jgi:hypothetical protein